MDDRFPKWLRKTVRFFDWMGIPNLGSLLCGVAILGFITSLTVPEVLDRFMFNPHLVLQGEWWRLFTFLFVGAQPNPIFLIFYVLYTYFVMNTLEQQWGPGPITFYVFLGYLGSLTGSLITGAPVDIMWFIMENVGLAFGTMFPNFELMIYFVLPVKAKWLAMIAGAMVLFKFIMGGPGTKIFLLCSFTPYLIFFGPYLFHTIRFKMRRSQNNRKFDRDMWR